jgi:hypothetical protein
MQQLLQPFDIYKKKMITLPQEFVDFLYIFGAVESKPAFLLQGFLSGNKP